jgi:hypothetical protein
MSSPSAERPRHDAATYPILGEIVADIRIYAGGCQMDAARFEHWARLLARELPYAEHPVLYQMLAGMAVELAARRAFAAVQLYALATLGQPAPLDEEIVAKSGVSPDELRRAHAVVDGARRTATATLPQPKAAGVSMRSAGSVKRPSPGDET